MHTVGPSISEFEKAPLPYKLATRLPFQAPIHPGFIVRRAVRGTFPEVDMEAAERED